ncbi:hypothetical protein [Dictyobacter alpinus]|uniref:hypothetical protein n=1 Tax=Dictyobacter alpinus TaxID=2014873 RepID=UPI000F8337F4|nr:hypothetical protein [Dictyobacter alpinus]
MNEKIFQSTFEPSFLIECIRKWYHVQALSPHRLPSDSGKYVYQAFSPLSRQPWSTFPTGIHEQVDTAAESSPVPV